jgi:hypothetical protein
VATDSENWTPDTSDWISESFPEKPFAHLPSPEAVLVETPPAESPATTTSARTVFDEPFDEPNLSQPHIAQQAANSMTPQAISDEQKMVVNAEAAPAEKSRTSRKGTTTRNERSSRRDRRDSRDISRDESSSSGQNIRAQSSPSRSKRQRARRRRKLQARRRLRLLPRSVIGISMMILAAGLGAAVSGTLLYMRYEYRRDISDANIKGFDKRVKLSTDSVVAEGKNAQARIQRELDPLLKQAATGDTLARILADAKPSILTVQTFDEGGAPIIGTAFVEL